MLSNFILTLPLAILTLVSFSTAFQYDLICDYGMKAAQCTSKYGTYCTAQGQPMKPGPSGSDCTTNRSPGPHGGVNCYCKFHFVASPKPTGKFDPNEILQQRDEAALPLPTPTSIPRRFYSGLAISKIAPTRISEPATSISRTPDNCPQALSIVPVADWRAS